MNLRLFFVCFFSFLISILSYDIDTISKYKKSYLNNIEQQLSIEIIDENHLAQKKGDDDDDDDGDDEPKENDKNTKNPDKTKSTTNPTPVGNPTGGNPPIDMDPLKYKELTQRGLDQIEIYEKRGDKTAVKNISKILLNNSIPTVRAEAAKSLGRLGKGTKSLHKAINTDGYEVRQQAYKSLEIIGSRSSLKFFIKGIQSSDASIVISSFKGLGKTKAAIGRDLILKQGLNSNEPLVVAAALEGLGNYSRIEDLDFFEKYLKTGSQEQKIGAIKGLGNHKARRSLSLLLLGMKENKELEPEVIYSIDKKKNLPGTIALVQILNITQNENYKVIIQKAIQSRKAFGKYAIISVPKATLRKYPRAGAIAIIKLLDGDVGRIKQVTSKRFKAKMNGEVIEDKYYLLQTIDDEGKRKSGITEGWVFGPKIKIISVSNPNKGGGGVPTGKRNESLGSKEEDSEDEEVKVVDPVVPKDDSKKSESKPNEKPKDDDDEEE